MELLTGYDFYVCNKEKDDPKFYGNDPESFSHKDTRGESRFLYFLQKYLNQRRVITMNYRGSPIHIIVRDYDGENRPKNSFIKKRMRKDGHETYNVQQYLRTKRPITFRGIKYHVGLYNDRFSINRLSKDWNNGQAVVKVIFMKVED